MIDLTVKTLDSQNHAFSLNDDITVRQFKEHIADTVNIPADLQRLIYCGRVLQDEKNLSEYDVNGKVIHLVQRAPPSMHQRPTNAGQNQSHNHGPSGDWPSIPRIHYRQTQFHGNPMYVGSVSIPADVLEGNAEWPMPQMNNSVANNHLNVIRRMLDQANRVIDRLGDPIASTTSSPENTTPQMSAENNEASASSAPPEEAPVEQEETPQPEAEPVPGSSTESSTNEALVPRQLAELLEKLLTTQDRLKPYIRDHILTSTSSTTEENQRIMDGVSECFHFISHAQHALSDISIDMQQTPPRTIRCRPMIIQPSAILQAGLPIQVEAHISLHGQSDNNSPSDTPTTPAQPTSAPNAETTPLSSTESSEPRPRPERPERPERPADQRQSDSPFGQVFNFPNNVEVVMEMGPQTPRVWSFSTGDQPQGNNNNNVNQQNNNNTNTNANNNNTGTAPGASGFSWGAAPSPDIIRNLMQAVAGYMAQTGVPMPAPSTTVSSTTATTTSATNPTVGCLRHRGRTVAVGESASSQPRANTDTHPTTSTQTRTTARTHVFHQHAQALGVGVNVAHSLDFDPFLACNSQHIRRQQAQTSTAASTQTGQANAASDASTQSQNGSTPSGPRFATITGVQIVNNSGFNGPSLAETIANSERLRRSDRPISFNNFLLTRGIHLASSFEFPSSGRQRTILQRIYIVLSKLTVPEWFRILGGDYAPLNVEIQESLRSTLREAFPSASEENLPTQIIESILQELKPYVERTLDGEDVRDDGVQVAMRETIDAQLTVHLRNIVNCLFATHDTNIAFVEAVIVHIKTLADNLIGCCRLTLRGSQGGFERVVARFANHMTRGMHEVFREWILGTVVEWVCNYSRGVQSPPKEEIKKLLCYKDGTINSPTSQSEPAVSIVTAPPPQSTIQPVPEPMETDSGPDPLDENEEVPTTFPGHENLLPDWVPIIARDGARQRRQLQLGLSGSSVTTLSDAYLATMPNKRRKLVEQQKPTLLASPTPSNSVIPASMERLVRESVGRAGVEEVDGAAAAVAADSTVRSAFGQAIRECLHPRRYQTPDFPDPLRFPNATKFFSDHDGHGKQ